MRNPKSFTVSQPIPGQTFPKPLFVIHAYSLAQARALVAAKVAGETIVVGPVSHRRSKTDPNTKNGLPAMACVSAMQKAIRRGMAIAEITTSLAAEEVSAPSSTACQRHARVTSSPRPRPRRQAARGNGPHRQRIIVYDADRRPIADGITSSSRRGRWLGKQVTSPA